MSVHLNLNRSLFKAKCESHILYFIASDIKWCIHEWILGMIYICFYPKNNKASGQTLDLEIWK